MFREYEIREVAEIRGRIDSHLAAARRVTA
jgi:hypothetical protein